MKYLPFTINFEFLVELRMQLSKLEKLWDGIKLLPNLKWLDLQQSRNLKKLPNLSMATNLQGINLRECSSLKELPSSIGNATDLQELDLTGCSNLKKLPSSVGNLHKLLRLYLSGCSKLKALPININMESLDELDLADCLLLKRFPEISTNIRRLYLIGTSIKEGPCSIRSWSRLHELHIPYSENLKEFPNIHNNIKELHSSDPTIQELGPWVRGLSRLNFLVLKGMQKLVSLPQLPDSLTSINLNGCLSLVSLPQLPTSLWLLDAENCESLEKLDCSFCNPYISSLKFVNCFKLNQEARDLIIQTSIRGFAVLPGKEVPECFTYRAYGNSVTVKLNQMPLRRVTIFKVCILFYDKGEDRVGVQEKGYVSCRFKSKQKALTERHLDPIITDHLFIFNIEAEEVTSTELVFEFELTIYSKSSLEIKECGIIQLLEHHVPPGSCRGCEGAMCGREDQIYCDI